MIELIKLNTLPRKSNLKLIHSIWFASRNIVKSFVAEFPQISTSSSQDSALGKIELKVVSKSSMDYSQAKRFLCQSHLYHIGNSF
jgi:hypothetical protein